MPGFLSHGKGVPLLLSPEYSGINKGQRVPDRSKTAHRKPLVKCFQAMTEHVHSSSREKQTINGEEEEQGCRVHLGYPCNSGLWSWAQVYMVVLSRVPMSNSLHNLLGWLGFFVTNHMVPYIQLLEGSLKTNTSSITTVSKYGRFKILFQDRSCCCCCKVASVMSDSVRPRRRQPTRLPRPWGSPGQNTGVGCRHDASLTQMLEVYRQQLHLSKRQTKLIEKKTNVS